MLYPEQPSEQLTDNLRTDKMRLDKIRTIIQVELEDKLPDCATNDWFIKSVYFANTLDSIMQTIWENA